MLSFNINASAWEKVPVPDYVDKKKKSPWNFYDDFENQKLGKPKLKQYSINNKGAGLKPFEIKKDANGNTYLEITVKHGWNNDPYRKKGKETERAEFQVKPKRTLNKEIWIGFKMRLPKDFMHINTRVLFFQFKNQHDPMKKSPLLGIRFYENGNLLDIGGDTGGNPARSYNKKEYFKHGIRSKYFKVSEDFNLIEIKKRNSDYIKIWKGPKLPPFFDKCNVSENNIMVELPDYCDDKTTLTKSFKSTPLGEWTTYKIGIHNSRKEDGFVKVYKDDQLIMNYEGITFDWKGGQYTGSHIRIGPYRDSDRFALSTLGNKTKGHPPQSIHYDDFIVVSDKKTLDQYLK